MKLLSNNKEFAKFTNERQKELIEIDAFNSMQYFVGGNISITQFLLNLDKLATKGVMSKSKILDFVKIKVSYEAFEISKMRKGVEKKQIEERMYELNRVKL